MDTYTIDSINTPVPPQRIYPLEKPQEDSNEVQNLPINEDNRSSLNEKETDREKGKN